MSFLLTSLLEDAKFFSIPDPPSPTTAEDKPEESIIERPISEITELPPSVVDGDAIASSSGDSTNEPPVTVEEYRDANSLPPLATQSLEGGARAEERAEHAAVLNVVTTHDRFATEISPGTNQTGSFEIERVTANASQVESSRPESSAERTAGSGVTLPVGHAYYFLQIFDADTQALRTVGSFFSKLEANVKASIRKHMQWPVCRDFVMWKRVDGTTITTVSPAENFMDVVVPHGSCIIVGDKLSRDK